MITAHEVETAKFRRAAVGKVGYDEIAVDDFLDTAAATLTAIERGESMPEGALSSHDVVEAEFPERGANIDGGYDLDDVDDLLDQVAQRIFMHETGGENAVSGAASAEVAASPELPQEHGFGSLDAGRRDDGGVADAAAIAHAGSPERVFDDEGVRFAEDAPRGGQDRTDMDMRGDGPIAARDAAVVSPADSGRDGASEREGDGARTADARTADARTAEDAEPGRAADPGGDAAAPAGGFGQGSQGERRAAASGGINPVGGDPLDEAPVAAPHEREEHGAQARSEREEQSSARLLSSGAAGSRGDASPEQSLTQQGAGAQDAWAARADQDMSETVGDRDEERREAQRRTESVPEPDSSHGEPASAAARRSGDGEAPASGRTGSSAVGASSPGAAAPQEEPRRAATDQASVVAQDGAPGAFAEPGVPVRDDAPAQGAGDAGGTNGADDALVRRHDAADFHDPQAAHSETFAEPGVAVRAGAQDAGVTSLPTSSSAPLVDDDANRAAERRFDAERRDDVVADGAAASTASTTAPTSSASDAETRRAGDLGAVEHGSARPMSAVRPTMGAAWPAEAPSSPSVAVSEPADDRPQQGSAAQAEPIVSYPATDHRVPLPRGDVRSSLSDEDREAESRYHPEYSEFAAEDRGPDAGVLPPHAARGGNDGASDAFDPFSDGGAVGPQRVAPMNEEAAPVREPHRVESTPPAVADELARREDERIGSAGGLGADDALNAAPIERPEPIVEPAAPAGIERPDAIERPRDLPERDDSSRKGILRRIFKG